MQAGLLYISGLFFLLSSCGNSTNKEDDNHRNTLTTDTSISRHQERKVENDTLLSNWNKDSLGCLHIRRYETALSLEKKYDLANRSIDEIRNLLGKPNKTIVDNKTKVLRYYCNTCCENGELKTECDYSWVDFTFNDPAVNKCIMTSGVM